jgi:hypothetical protein
VFFALRFPPSRFIDSREMGLDLGVAQGEVKPVHAGQGQGIQARAANYHDLVHIACGGDGLLQGQGNLGTFSAIILISHGLHQPCGPVPVGVLPGGGRSAPLSQVSGLNYSCRPPSYSIGVITAGVLRSLCEHQTVP